MNSTINVFKHKLYFAVFETKLQNFDFCFDCGSKTQVSFTDGIPTAVGCHLEAHANSIFGKLL